MEVKKRCYSAPTHLQTSTCASSTTPFGSKAKKRRMSRGKSFNQVPGGIEWPDLVDIKILDLLVMAHNENGDFSGLNPSCATYWEHLVHHLNDYIKSHFPEVPEKTISDVQGRYKALRTSYRKTKDGSWRFGNDKGKILDKIRVPFNIPTSRGVASMLTTTLTTTTTEKCACHAEGSDAKLAKSVILGRLELNEIFEERNSCKFVLQMEAKDIELLGRTRDVDLPRIAMLLYGEMEEKRHAKKEAKMQAREEAKRKRKLEKRAARGAA